MFTDDPRIRFWSYVAVAGLMFFMLVWGVVTGQIKADVNTVSQILALVTSINAAFHTPAKG